MSELAVNNRVSKATGMMSPFHLSDGYNLEPIQLSELVPVRASSRSPIAAGEGIANRLTEAHAHATTM